MNRQTLFIFLTTLSAACYADADQWYSPLDNVNFDESDENEEDRRLWSGEAEFGFTQTTGNTETDSLNAEFNVVHELPHWRNALSLEALTSSEDGDTTAEKYKTAFQTSYKLVNNQYVFAGVNYEDDRFSGFEFQSSLSLGYGANVIHTSQLALALEAGPGLRNNKLEESGENEEDAILRTAAKLFWRVSETALFRQQLSNEAGENNVITNSDTSLKVNINGSLALRVSLNIKHTSDVPEDVESTDSETKVTLVYGF